RPRAPEEVIANRLRQRTVSNLLLEHGLELDVAARDRIADDNQLDVLADVLRRIADHDRDLLGREEVAHRRIDVEIGPANDVTALFEQRGNGRHGRAADADQVNLHTPTGDSSTTIDGRGVVTIRTVTPSGSVHDGP